MDHSTTPTPEYVTVKSDNMSDSQCALSHRHLTIRIFNIIYHISSSRSRISNTSRMLLL